MYKKTLGSGTNLFANIDYSYLDIEYLNRKTDNIDVETNTIIKFCLHF